MLCCIAMKRITMHTKKYVILFSLLFFVGFSVWGILFKGFTALVVGPPATSLFATSTRYTTGPSSHGSHSADFNGDGVPDIIATSCTGNYISLFLNNGIGVFGARTDFPVADCPAEMASADFNGDGKRDVVAVGYSSSSVSVLMGTGTGSFEAPVYYAVGLQNRQPTVGDFNGDGKIDFVVGSEVSNDLEVFLNNGDGTFAPRVSYPVPALSAPSGIDVGDLNGDGSLDMVVVNNAIKGYSVFLGNGDGTFQAAVTQALTTFPYDDALADMDVDGKLDLIVYGGSGTVSFLKGNGDGTFQLPVIYPVQGYAQSVLVLDMDGDGKLDVVTTDSAGGGIIDPLNAFSFLKGNGDGTLESMMNTAVGTDPWGMSTADYNQDGKPDLAVAMPNDREVKIFLSSSVRISDTAINAIEGDSNGSYDIVLTAPPTTTVMVTVSPDALETVSTSSIAFTPSNWNISVPVIVTAVDDAVVQGIHVGTITHTVAGDATYDGIVVPSVSVTITDNDVAPPDPGGGGLSAASVPPPLVTTYQEYDPATKTYLTVPDVPSPPPVLSVPVITNMPSVPVIAPVIVPVIVPTSTPPALLPESYFFKRSLSYGSRGEDVRQLQIYLNANGAHVDANGAGSNGKETMVFGPATRAALITFQKAHLQAILGPNAKLYQANGMFGPKTRSFVNGGSR